MKNPKAIIDEITLGDNGKVIACKGRIVSKNKIVNLDNLYYKQILVDLGIEVI